MFSVFSVFSVFSLFTVLTVVPFGRFAPSLPRELLQSQRGSEGVDGPVYTTEEETGSLLSLPRILSLSLSCRTQSIHLTKSLSRS